MKPKLLITAFVCSIALAANAQTEKGKNLIGGAVSYSRTSAKEDNGNGKTYGITIAPNYGHFVHNNLAIGLALGYAYSKQNSETQGYFSTPSGYVFTTAIETGISKVYYGGPFIRHYLDLADKFKIYNQFSANIGKGTQSYHSQFSDFYSKYTSFGAAINSGLTFLPTKKLAVEIGFDLISYNRAKTSNQQNNVESIERSDTFKIGFSSFNPSLGVNLHF